MNLCVKYRRGVWTLQSHTPLPTSTFDFVPQSRQFCHHFITMVALNLDIAILDGATRATQLFELLCQRGQLRLASRHSIDNCHGFPSAPFAVAHHAYNSITLLCGGNLLTTAAIFIQLTASWAGGNFSFIG